MESKRGAVMLRNVVRHLLDVASDDVLIVPGDVPPWSAMNGRRKTRGIAMLSKPVTEPMRGSSGRHQLGSNDAKRLL